MKLDMSRSPKNSKELAISWLFAIFLIFAVITSIPGAILDSVCERIKKYRERRK